MKACLIGFFRFSMRANGKEMPAIAQVHSPGLPQERLLHVIRCEWGDRLQPGMSQNRIECLGWEAIEAPAAGWERMKAGSANPVTIWREISSPDA